MSKKTNMKTNMKMRTDPVSIWLPDTELQRKLYKLNADPQFCAWV